MYKRVWSSRRLLATLLVIGAVVPGKSNAGCTVDEDCSLNGVCKTGKCSCAPEWTGEY